MQQSSATPKKQDVGIGLQKMVACSQSSSQCIYSFCHGVIPTSYFIFNEFYISLIFYAGFTLGIRKEFLAFVVQANKHV